MNENEPKTTIIAIACAGSVDSGKSSLLGVLVGGNLDDGNGKTRKLIARHPHEIASGKTSDVSTRIYNLAHKNESIALVDLCGHDKYFKTTVSGTLRNFPDYAFLIVSANRGILPMTKQHLKLLLCFSVPIIIIITHIDITPAHIYERTKESIANTLKKYAGTKSKICASFVNSPQSQDTPDFQTQAVNAILGATSNTVDGKQIIFPILSISNVTGFYINTIRETLEQIKPRQFWNPIESNNKVVKFFQLGLIKLNPSQSLPPPKPFTDGVFYIDTIYNPPGVGLVAAGINRGTTIKSNTQLYIGPFTKGIFEPFSVKSIHNNNKQFIQELPDHHRGCIAISKLSKSKREQIRKHMIIISNKTLEQNVCYRFKALITVFEGSVLLRDGYSPMIHMCAIRQTARMEFNPSENNNMDTIQPDSENRVALVTFKFKYRPELVYPYDIFAFRSGNIQGMGMILEHIPITTDIDAKPDPIKLGFNKKIRLKKRERKSKSVLPTPPQPNPPPPYSPTL